MSGPYFRPRMLAFRDGFVPYGPMTASEGAVAGAIGAHYDARLGDLHVVEDRAESEVRVWLLCGELHVLIAFGCEPWRLAHAMPVEQPVAS
jgi:hypothetical protein